MWQASHKADEITFRLSFKRDDSIADRPLITTSARLPGRMEEETCRILLAAINACVPLQFTPRLGVAIAGRVFLIRLVAPKQEQLTHR